MITPIGMAAMQSRIAEFRSMSGTSTAGGRLGASAESSSATSFDDVLTKVDDRSLSIAGASLFTTSAAAGGAGSDRVAGVPFADLFNSAGEKYGISPKVLAAVAKVESSYHTDAVSPAGAQGMMQFMPATAAGLGVDPFDPASAVDGAARMLSGLTQRFGSVDLALAAYNIGSGALARAGGIQPGSQAERYVGAVHRAMEALA